jgi:hypothetical protein
MSKKLSRKFKGISYDHCAEFKKRPDALDKRNALIAEGHKAKMSKDPIHGLYHVYVHHIYVIPGDDFSVTQLSEPVEPLKFPEPPPIPYMAGLDFLKVSLHLDWKNPEFMTMLQDFKEEFNEEELNKNPDAKERSLEFCGGMSFNMQRTGAGNYSYVLKCGDITFLFSNHKANAQFPNCRIEIGSMSCWHPGWLHLFETITAWLRSQGASFVKQKVTELHLCADLLGAAYDLTGFTNKERWTSHCNKGTQHFEDWQYNYLSLGKGDFMFRCYNKTGELDPESAKHDFFHDLWRANTGHDVKHVTRLEFQIRRTIIKKLGIKSVSDLRQKLNSLWAYCVGDGDENKGWCRFLDREMTPTDRKNKNHQRYETDSLWETVRNIRFNGGRTHHLVRDKTQHVNIDLLLKMMAGCASSVCGAVGLAEEDHAGHIKFAADLLRDQMGKNFQKDPNEYKRKIKTKHNAAEITF